MNRPRRAQRARERLLSTRQAAQLLAVGPSSVKRWANVGLLPCVKTAGGHRRFARVDVQRFWEKRVAGEIVESVVEMPDGPLVIEADVSSKTVADWVRFLIEAESVHAVEGRLLAERDRLGAWWRVADHLELVLVELGRWWERGALSIIQERIASENLHRALAQIAARLPNTDTAPRCLLVGVEGDPHTLGLSLAEVCVCEMGWRTIWAGGHTPITETLVLLREEVVEMVVVSASVCSSDEEKMRRIEERLSATCEQVGTHLVLVGSGAWPAGSENRIHAFESLRQLSLERKI